MYLEYLSEYPLHDWGVCLHLSENLCYVTILQTHWDIILGHRKVKRTQSKGISKPGAIFYFFLCVCISHSHSKVGHTSIWTQSNTAGVCSMLVCKPPIHKKSKPAAQLVHVRLSSECFCTSEEYIHQQCCLLKYDAYWCQHQLSGRLSNFIIYRVPPSFGLNLWVDRILQQNTSLFGQGGLRNSSCVAGHSCFHTSSILCPSTQKPCPRPPSGTDGEPWPSTACRLVFTPIKWTLGSAVSGTGPRPQVWKHPKGLQSRELQ